MLLSKALQAPINFLVAGEVFGGNRGFRRIPPEKGIFPLDHFHECDSVLLQ